MMKKSQKLSNSVINKNKNKKDLLENFDVFGKDLKVLEEMDFGKEVPEIIWMMGYFIRTYGILIQGLFRISGNRTRMDDIKASYIKKRSFEVNIDDIHNITGLYKGFIREIPNGLVPFSQSTDLINAMKVYKTNENLDLLKSELLKMPVLNYNLLKYSCHLLNLISQYSASNLMSAENLGTVFGPTFFTAIEDVSLLSLQNSLASLLIQKYDDLFKVSAPVHVNLNESSDCTNKFDSLPSITSSVNGNVSNISNSDQNLILKFGDSSMVVNISPDDLQLNTYIDEDNLQLSESVDLTYYSTNGSGNNNNIYNTGNSIGNGGNTALTRSLMYPNPNNQNNQHHHYHSQTPNYPHHISSPLSSAIKMCVSNHLGLLPPYPNLSYDSDMGSLPLSTSSSLNYDNSLPSSASYQPNNTNTNNNNNHLHHQPAMLQFYPAPFLIGDMMLNPEQFYYQSLQHRFLQNNCMFGGYPPGGQMDQSDIRSNLKQSQYIKKRSGSIQHDPPNQQYNNQHNQNNSRRSASVLGHDVPSQSFYQTPAPDVPPRSASEMRQMLMNTSSGGGGVPQLDLSIFKRDDEDDDDDKGVVNDDIDDECNQQYDMVPNDVKKKQVSNYNKLKNIRHNSIDVGQLAHQNPTDIELTSQLESSQLNKKISNLKKQLRLFDDKYYDNNGIRPDKTTKMQNSWYTKTVNELKQLRQMKEKLISGSESTQPKQVQQNSQSQRHSNAAIHSNATTDIEEESEHELYQYQNQIISPSQQQQSQTQKAPPVIHKRRNTTSAITDQQNNNINPCLPNKSSGQNTTSNYSSRPVSALSDMVATNAKYNYDSSNTLDTPITATGTPTSKNTPTSTDNISDQELMHLKRTLDAISSHLDGERRKDGRPENIDEMTLQQIEIEKTTMQKALLNFENTYGRSRNSRAVQMMKPLYDRYRQIKKKLSQPQNEIQKSKKSAWIEDSKSQSRTTNNNTTIVMPSEARWNNQASNNQSLLIPFEEDNSQTKLLSDTGPPKVVPRKNNANTAPRNMRRIDSNEQRNEQDPNRNKNQKTSISSGAIEITQELQRLMIEKKELQIILKEFENNFEKETNRKVDRTDRIPMEREYLRYKQIKNRIKELEDLSQTTKPSSNLH